MDQSKELDRLKELINLVADSELSEYQAFLTEKDEGFKMTDATARAKAKVITNNMRMRYKLEWDYLMAKITYDKAQSSQDLTQAEESF